MITIKDDMIDARELHTKLKSKKPFAGWIREKIKQADFHEGIEFFPSKELITGVGRPQINYQITIDAAKEICLLQQTPEGHKLRRELIRVSNKVDNMELLTIPQAALAHNLIQCLKYVENMRLAEKVHAETYLQNTKENYPAQSGSDQFLYKEFHLWRNKVLDLDRDTLEKRIKEFCISNGRNLPKLGNKTDKLIFMGMEFTAFRNAVFDLLAANGTDENKSMLFAETVKKIAEQTQVQLHRRNEDTFFQKEEAGIRVSEMSNQLKSGAKQLNS